MGKTTCAETSNHLGTTRRLSPAFPPISNRKGDPGHPVRLPLAYGKVTPPTRPSETMSDLLHTETRHSAAKVCFRAVALRERQEKPLSYRFEVIVVSEVCGPDRSSYARRHVKAQVASSPPHARGGVPHRRPAPRWITDSSPRTWGCSLQRQAIFVGRGLLPTHVGVFRPRSVGGGDRRAPPHARGGVPLPATRARGARASSPHTWGCSWCPGRH